MLRDSKKKKNQFTHECACQMKINQSTAYTSTTSLMGLSFSRPPSTCPNPLRVRCQTTRDKSLLKLFKQANPKPVSPASSIPPRWKHNHVSCSHFPSSVLSDSGVPLTGVYPHRHQTCIFNANDPLTYWPHQILNFLLLSYLLEHVGSQMPPN